MKNKVKAYIGLVHSPVLNKRGEIVTTSVTNLDIHDIARTSRTFGFENYFIVTPIKLQQQLVGRITTHWEGDEGNQYNPDRSSALSFVLLRDSIEDSIKTIEEKEGQRPMVVVTGANFKQYDGDTSEVLRRLSLDNKPMFLLFGTGWGLPASVTESADFRLVPLFGAAEDGYNHLSVRSAVAIYSDRLFGSRGL